MAPIWSDLQDGGDLPLAPFRNEVWSKGGRVPDPSGSARLEYVGGPKLRLHSGEILASDAFLVRDEPIAFSQRLPSGDYPTEIIRARPPAGHAINALAILRVQDQTPICWAMATRLGESLSDLRRDERFAYGVDMGTGCFTDIQTALAIDPEMPTDKGIYEVIQRDLQASDGLASTAVDAERGWNIVAFYSGRGDGSYTSYWGLDQDQQPVCLVTDFGIVKTSAFVGAHEVIGARAGLSNWLKGWTRR